MLPRQQTKNRRDNNDEEEQILDNREFVPNNRDFLDATQVLATPPRLSKTMGQIPYQGNQDEQRGCSFKKFCGYI
jgi:hypothetical protein